MFTTKKTDDIYSHIEHQVQDFAPRVGLWFSEYLMNHTNARMKPEIYIGTDSSSLRGRTTFTIAIVINSRGFGGEYIFKKFSVGRYLSLFEKIYSEAHTSVQIAREIQKLSFIQAFSDIVVHVDANPNESAKSFQYFQAIIGMVKGNGFEVVGKPHAYAASCVADRHCRS